MINHNFNYKETYHCFKELKINPCCFTEVICMTKNIYFRTTYTQKSGITSDYITLKYLLGSILRTSRI